ncbi:MAG: efflux RND transporter periplasmic adaptor subunit [Amphiplicatus sp.]
MMKWLLARPRLVLAALLVAGALGVGAAVAGRDKAPDYQTATVRRGDLEVSISAAGKVQPKYYVDVGAQVSGQLKSFLVDVGEQVEKGQLLAEIDETLAKAKVDADRAQLKELQASFAQQEATLELSKAAAARAKMLFAADAISEAENQAAIADLKVATARLAQLAAQIERQQSTLDGDLASLSYTKIYAPMSGTVVLQAAVVGQTLNANQTTPTILRIADLSVMTVEAEVSEADVLRVKAGQNAYFTTLGDMSNRWRTTVRQALPQPEVVNDVVLYKVLLDIQNTDELLKPEMTAQVFFITGKAADAVLVPVAALRDMRGPNASRPNGSGLGARRDGDQAREPGLMAARANERGEARGGPSGEMREAMRTIREKRPDARPKMVLVMNGKKPEPRPVLVGLASRADAEILFGLEPGDVVVTGETSAAPPPRRDNQRFGGRMFRGG